MSNKYPGGLITSGADAGYSVAFDGTGDYLTLGGQSAFAFGTGDFTIEMWAYVNSGLNTDIVYYDGRPTSTNGLYNIIYTNSTGKLVYNTNSADRITGTTTLVAGGWYHIALSRSGTSTRLFLNGAQEGSTYTDSNSYIVGASRPVIGGNGFTLGNAPLNGYISNLRVVKGTALYTAAFTPPTQLFAITNTSLLTCNSPTIVDQSSNNFAITINGNAAVSTFTPFKGYVAYNPALGAATPGIWSVSDAIQAAQTRRWNMYDPYFNLTTLLLHGNYTGSVNSSGTAVYQNNNFLDSSSNNFTITRNGNTTQGTFSPFSQTGWSNFFDGSSALTTPNNTAFDFGTGDFTVEAWVYFTSLSLTKYTFMGKWASGLAWIFQTDATTKVGIALANSGVYTSGNYFSEAGLVTGQWMHLAVSRSGTTLRIFKNGVVIGTFTSSENITATETFYIARNGGASQDFPGYISNARVVKGTAVYTTAFTPSAAPLTAVAGTSLLACQDNRFKDNSANNFTLTPSGTPSVQAFSPFYPLVAYTPQAQGGSGYFDGTTDYLTVANNTALQVGSGDFTIEGWYYPTNSPSQADIFTKYSAGSQEWGVIDASSSLGFYAGTGGASWTLSPLTFGTVKVNQWNHFAVCRSGSTFSTFLNGTRGATTTNSFTIGATNISVGIGSGNGFSGNFVNGYVSNYRIVKGTAVYDVSQTSITVPTAPFTNIANTSLLCNFTNGGIVDSSAKNVLETVADSKISTTQSKFGGSSIALDGTGDWLQIPNIATNDLGGTTAFTIEFWVYASSINPRSCVISRNNGSTAAGSQFDVNIETTGQVSTNFYSSSSAIQPVSATGVISTNTWTHVAISKDSSGNYRIFINGTQSGSTVTNTSSINSPSLPILVGVTSSSGNNPFNGYIDELRITRGFARYTANFTPQTSQWQDQ